MKDDTVPPLPSDIPFFANDAVRSGMSARSVVPKKGRSLPPTPNDIPKMGLAYFDSIILEHQDKIDHFSAMSPQERFHVFTSAYLADQHLQGGHKRFEAAMAAQPHNMNDAIETAWLKHKEFLELRISTVKIDRKKYTRNSPKTYIQQFALPKAIKSLMLKLFARR